MQVCRTSIQTVSLALGIVCTLPWQSLRAEFPPASIAQIAAAAEQSAEQLDPSKIADVDTAKQNFLAAVDGLRQHLGRTATDQNAQAWLNYLEIDPVLNGLESGASEAVLATDTIRISQQATGLHPGLEVPAVRKLRSESEAFSNSLRFYRKERTTDLLARQLQRSAQKWAEDDFVPTPDEIAMLQVVLDLLERTGQQVPLLDQSQSLFSSPNLHLTIDDSLVQRGINRSVRKCSPVNDCILGTRIIGDALLTGNVTATLLPSVGSVRVQIALQGNIVSNNMGYNGPVRLRTSGVGQAYATRVATIDESGLEFEPVAASGALDTRIDAIEHRLRLVRKIARKRAAQQKPLADKISHRKFINKLSTAFAEETEGTTAQPSTDVLGQARTYLNRLNFPEPQRLIGSTSESIFFNATLRKGSQLAAPAPPPAIAMANEATVQLHESAINNTLGALFAGREMTEAELKSLAESAGLERRDPPADADPSDQESKEPFEIEFDRSRPIIFEARDGQLRIGIRGIRFTQGSRELRRPLEIAAAYQPTKTASGKIVLERIGEAEVNFPGTKRLSIAQTGLRSSIKQNLADAFPAVLMDQPWTVPATVKSDGLRGRTFQPTYFDAQDGWLTLGVSSF
ncbi:hypothetical protein NHH03_25090 [Stieleria sp. TO1_6]|uniref:hypothetical protein n=1 Tax=Stieleria tagensis TaxID=2956795 RepID=UPI00209BAE6E|nr:hypothetical protein [Stieleria tagensis]MCO8125037.1 hypothetical protein [Stieleria tagensis]